MANLKCCFGLFDIRKYVVIIASFYMSLSIVICSFTLMVLLMGQNLNDVPCNLNDANDYQQTIFKHNEVLRVSILLYIIFISLASFYINIILKKATQKRNVQSLLHWLVFNSVFLIFFEIILAFVVVKYNFLGVLIILFVLHVGHGFHIYIVNLFYKSELESLATTQCLNFPITSQPGPSTINGIESRQCIIREAVQPTIFPYYQQQIGQPSSIGTNFPVSESPIQEYTNPPPYYPSFNKKENPLANN